MSLAVLGTVAIAGFRHGFDIDHIAAISDMSSSQQSRRRAFLLATSYAIGHMLVVLGLGSAAVLAGVKISEDSASIASRTIGLTLIALGIYVAYSLIRFRRDFRMVGRWMLITAGVRRVLHWLRPPTRVVIEHEHEHAHGPHRHDHVHDAGSASQTTAAALRTTTVTAHVHPHKHVVTVPADPFTEYSSTAAFVIGLVHGVGAETPTQILLFTAAAGMAGSFGGIAIVVIFVTGLLVGNLLLTVLATAGFTTGQRMPALFMALAAVTAALSIWVGAAYLTGRPGLLPSFLGG